MKLSELSELHLAAVVAGATFLGGLGSSLLGVFLVDAGTERQTDVQLVQLAIGILSEPAPSRPAGWRTAEVGLETPEAALRAWAVDTINAAAEIKFDEGAKHLLVSGEVRFAFSSVYTGTGTVEAWGIAPEQKTLKRRGVGTRRCGPPSDGVW